MRIQFGVALVLSIFGVSAGIQPAIAQEKGLLYAHRGGAYEFDENTMQGFAGCYEKGIRGFETDIRMTKDGVLVLLHDDSLDRTHHGTGPVEHKTAAEIRDITTKKSGQKFLFLEEFLDYLADKPEVYLELEMKTSNKNLYPDSRLEEYCKKLHAMALAKMPKGSFYYMTSFDERPLKIIREMDPNAKLLLITGGPCTKEFVEKALSLGVQRVGCRMEGTSRAAVKEAQKAGLKVNGWPGQNVQDYHLAVGLGVDAICSDIPLEILALIEKTKK